MIIWPSRSEIWAIIQDQDHIYHLIDTVLKVQISQINIFSICIVHEDLNQLRLYKHVFKSLISFDRFWTSNFVQNGVSKIGASYWQFATNPVLNLSEKCEKRYFQPIFTLSRRHQIGSWQSKNPRATWKTRYFSVLLRCWIMLWNNWLTWKSKTLKKVEKHDQKV